MSGLFVSNGRIVHPAVMRRNRKCLGLSNLTTLLVEGVQFWDKDFQFQANCAEKAVESICNREVRLFWNWQTR